MNRLELKLPPVALALVLAGAMKLAATLSPALALPFAGREVLAAVLAASGVGVALAGVIAFRRARTTVDPMRPDRAAALVATGIYRWSRNPMYLGFLLLLAAWSVRLAHPLALIALPLFVLYMNRFQIVPEERALRTRFGRAFDEYARSVRRWL
jgi:protein-S-isoprenylcysteine O-methyltransferase Ste14